MTISRALADEGRIRALMALDGRGEVCVCQLTELLALCPSTVSKHLSVLAEAGLVERRKRGRWVFYRLPGRDAPEPQRRAIRWATSSLRRDPRISQDRKRMKEILQIDAEVLCGRQRRN